MVGFLDCSLWGMALCENRKDPHYGIKVALSAVHVGLSEHAEINILQDV